MQSDTQIACRPACFSHEMHVPDNNILFIYIHCCCIVGQGAAVDSGASGAESMDEGNRPRAVEMRSCG